MQDKGAAIIVFILPLLFAGCMTQGPFKPDNPNAKVYMSDLNGDGHTQVIETEDKSATGSYSVLTVKNHDKNKITDTIDTFSIPGKIRNVEFIQLNSDEKSQMVVYSDEKENVSSIAVYELNNNKLSRIFNASSAYGIKSDFGTIARIKVGKASRQSNSAAASREWDSWVWCADKFARE